MERSNEKIKETGTEKKEVWMKRKQKEQNGREKCHFYPLFHFECKRYNWALQKY